MEELTLAEGEIVIEESERSDLAIGAVHPAKYDDDGRGGLALAAGLIAAIVGGLIWAAVVLLANLEIGWAAWAVGALVGLAMGRMTAQRSRSLGYAAAGLAVLGLLIGKLAISMGSTAALSKELLTMPEYLEGAVAWQMYEAEELGAETLASARVTIETGDTLSDALWEDMRRQAGVRLAGMTEPEKQALAGQMASGFVGRMGIIEAIWMQLSGWDVLWFGLAVTTAFGMLNAGKGQGERA